MAQQKDGVFTWLHSDHLHSATVLTDADGLDIRRLAYAAFGEEVANSGSGAAPTYTYTGKERDRSGLLYYGARYYDPALARFITADSVYDAGPQGLNRYSYALNNPILYRDPTGHFSVYVHTEGAGHVGVQVYEKDYDSEIGYSSEFQRNEQGDLIKNYDFGRYHGTYAGWNIRFYSGPNILKVSSGEPYVLKKHGGTLYRISVSQQLDHLVAHKFKDVFEKGL